MQSPYDRKEDFPRPSRDGILMYVDMKDGWLKKYVSSDGVWVLRGLIYPATTD